jgi:hypothetical protein
MSSRERASGLKLAKTSCDPLAILPDILSKSESDPRYSPIQPPTAAPLSTAPINNGRAAPPVPTIAMAASTRVAPNNIPVIKPDSALL